MNMSKVKYLQHRWLLGQGSPPEPTHPPEILSPALFGHLYILLLVKHALEDLNKGSPCDGDNNTQLFTGSKLTIQTLDQGVK